jgi:hypothetical protein
VAIPFFTTEPLIRKMSAIFMATPLRRIPASPHSVRPFVAQIRQLITRGAYALPFSLEIGAAVCWTQLSQPNS